MTATHRIFLYGTLLDPVLFEIVGGQPLSGRSGVLAGHAVHWAQDESFPLIRASEAGHATGLVVEVDDAARGRLDFYELGFGYTLETREVAIDGAAQEALVYFPEPERWPLGPRWSLGDWQAAFGPLTRVAAAEYMGLSARMAPEEAAACFGQIRARAASRLRAEAAPSPDPFGGLPERAPEIAETGHPYTGFFGVREDRMAFPTFDGGLSAPVTRSTWLGADAVTVLPYDPVRDCVLMIRQFRHGAFSRGDPNPWCLEPVAGRIDPGESAEGAAERELVEEAGVRASRLIRIAGYYPTPAAVSEHLTSYVAVADLGAADGRVGGMAGEAEDIMTHVLPFDEAFALIESGAANTGPLILSLNWLALNRQSLRPAD